MAASGNTASDAEVGRYLQASLEAEFALNDAIGGIGRIFGVDCHCAAIS